MSTEKRCGWLSNPTPGNWDFIDRDGAWEIAVQGDSGALDGLPDDRPSGRKWWVETKSGGYGYGCICLDGQVDKQSKKFVKILGGKSFSLNNCRKDRAIKEREPLRTTRMKPRGRR